MNLVLASSGPSSHHAWWSGVLRGTLPGSAVRGQFVGRQFSIACHMPQSIFSRMCEEQTVLEARVNEPSRSEGKFVS